MYIYVVILKITSVILIYPWLLCGRWIVPMACSIILRMMLTPYPNTLKYAPSLISYWPTVTSREIWSDVEIFSHITHCRQQYYILWGATTARLERRMSYWRQELLILALLFRLMCCFYCLSSFCILCAQLWYCTIHVWWSLDTCMCFVITYLDWTLNIVTIS